MLHLVQLATLALLLPARAMQSGSMLRIASVSAACETTCLPGEGRVELRNDDSWLPADLSRLSLRITRALGASAQPGQRSRLQLRSEHHFDGEDGCASPVVTPGGSLTLHRLRRCSFHFPAFEEGDIVELLDDGSLLDVAMVGASAAQGTMQRHRRSMLQMDSAAFAYPTFSAFSLATVGLTAALAPPAAMVGPRRTSESRIGSARADGGVARTALPPPPATDDAAQQALYAASLTGWNDAQKLLTSQLEQERAAQSARLQAQTNALATAWNEDLARNRTAWDELEAAKLSVNSATQKMVCQTIVHSPVFTPGKFIAGSCTEPSVVPGTPPCYDPPTAGTWTPGRAAYFTPGYWTAEEKPVFTPGMPGHFTPGVKGYVIPGSCIPPTYQKASLKPGWVEKAC